MNYPEKVYLNGEIIDSDQAKISIFDRGFMFGDGIYEVLVQINGQLFYEQAHLDRLKNCLHKIGINYDISNLKSEIRNLLVATELTNKDCLIYIQITRGIAPRKHSFPENAIPTCIMYAIQKEFPHINKTNFSVVTTEDFRWTKCDIKMTSLLGNVLANQFAAENNCYETLLVRDGIITEASHCNVFFVKDELVYTHPANKYILNGITRQLVVDLCHKLGIRILEEGFPIKELKNIDEAFLTGTTTQIGAICTIDKHQLYGGNSIGPITKRLQQAFSELT